MRLYTLRIPAFPYLAFLAVALLLLWGLTGARRVEPALAPALLGHTVVIDAGHGGFDPGVTGSRGTPESTINLAVAEKLALYCRQGGAAVTLTRESDVALAERKADDLAARIAVADRTGADLFVSIHCNSYLGDDTQHGAQVFYRAGNEASAAAAALIQQHLCDELANSERRALAHPDSYLLQHQQRAAVIAEIGFLSNPEEEALLRDEEYQWRVAWAIYRGIEHYYAERSQKAAGNQ